MHVPPDGPSSSSSDDIVLPGAAPPDGYPEAVVPAVCGQHAPRGGARQGGNTWWALLIVDTDLLGPVSLADRASQEAGAYTVPLGGDSEDPSPALHHLCVGAIKCTYSFHSASEEVGL